jgi:hypothetical protein
MSRAFSFRCASIARWLALLAGACSALAASPALAGATIGTRDFSYGSAPSAPTSDKPQNKLWFNDGSWWASMFKPGKTSGGTFEIYRFDAATDTWSDSGTPIDSRSLSIQDTLWDGNHLYVLSSVPRARAGSTAVDLATRVYRYSYAAGHYSLDAGFPATLDTASNGTEVATIAKDSTGRLWVTDTRDNGPLDPTTGLAPSRTVYVTHSTTDDKTWTTAQALPTGNAAPINGDDISSVVAFNGQIGVLWSDQNTGAFYFAVHPDSADGTAGDDTAWTEETALTGVCHSSTGVDKSADDHLNVKVLPSGEVVAGVKTSCNDLGSSHGGDPLIELLVRPATGGWSAHTVWNAADDVTRPTVALDPTDNKIYIDSAQPCCSGGIIYRKVADLDNPSFTTGLGEIFIQGDADAKLNNPTTTKQTVGPDTGDNTLAASVGSISDPTRDYYHHYVSLIAPPPPDTPPTAPTSVTATAGDHHVVLAWTASTDDHGVTGYRVYRVLAGGPQLVTTVTGTSFDDEGLTDGVRYTYHVTAIDAVPNESQPSADVTAVPMGPAPPPPVVKPAPAPAPKPPPAVKLSTPPPGRAPTPPLLPLPHPAARTLETALGGPVRAELSYARAGAGARDLRLRIVRAGRTALDVALWTQCRSCGAAIPLRLGQGRSVAVRALDGGREPQVLVDLRARGFHLSLVYVRVAGRYRLVVHSWGTVADRVRRLGRATEWVTGDGRFSGAFTTRSRSYLPIRIWRFSHGRFWVATRLDQGAVRADAARLLGIYRRLRARPHTDLRGVLAAYTADQYLLGRGRPAVRFLSAVLRGGELAGERARDGLPDAQGYLRALRRLLVRWGYVH